MKDYLIPLNFANPRAVKFLKTFASAPTETTLVNALVVAADSIDFIGLDTVATTLVAAEIVAASFGQPSLDFPPDLQKFADEALPKLTDFRIIALDAVVAAINSFQAAIQFSEDFNDFNVWEASQQDLLNRLGN